MHGYIPTISCFLVYTGRAGEKGEAYTLITEKDKEFAGHLVRNLEGAGQVVPDELLDLAMKVITLTEIETFVLGCDNMLLSVVNNQFIF